MVMSAGHLFSFVVLLRRRVRRLRRLRKLRRLRLRAIGRVWAEEGVILLHRARIVWIAFPGVVTDVVPVERILNGLRTKRLIDILEGISW